MHFTYVQHVYSHVHFPDAEKCSGNEAFAIDPGSQLWQTELEDYVKGADQWLQKLA